MPPPYSAPKRRVTKEYNEALRQRGSLTVWFTDACPATIKVRTERQSGVLGQFRRIDIAIPYFEVWIYFLVCYRILTSLHPVSWHIDPDQATAALSLISRQPAPECPLCHVAATRLHSRYASFADIACG